MTASAADPGATASSRSGEPVVLPTSLSPSRAADFMTCPLLYRFRVVDRLPEPPSEAATRGTLVHSVLEELFDLPAVERTPDRALELVEPAWRSLLAEDPRLTELFEADSSGERPAVDEAAFLAAAEPLIRTWFTLEDPTRLEPAERELLVETPVADDLLLRGYVDRLDVAPDGAIRVVDYKTGRAPNPRFEQKALFQMRFYALVIWRVRGRLPRLLQLVYLGGGGSVLRYEPDEADLRATERKAIALWSAIRTAAESGRWDPQPSRLCDWCAHRALCPEFGGTPPPVPEIRFTTRPPGQPAPARTTEEHQ